MILQTRLYALKDVIELSVPYQPETLFISPGPEVTHRIMRGEITGEPVGAGRIWDTAEVLDLLLTGVVKAAMPAIVDAKHLFNGTVSVRRKH